MNVDLTDIDYIALADQDDIWKEDKLEKAIQKLEQGFDGYSSNVQAFWEGWPKKNNKKNQPQQKFDHLFESAGPGCTFVLTKKLALKLQQFLKNGHFNQLDNYHDWLIYAYARTQSFKWYIDSYPGVDYRQHSSQMFLGQMLEIELLYPSLSKCCISGEGVYFAISD